MHVTETVKRIEEKGSCGADIEMILEELDVEDALKVAVEENELIHYHDAYFVVEKQKAHYGNGCYCDFITCQRVATIVQTHCLYTNEGQILGFEDQGDGRVLMVDISRMLHYYLGIKPNRRLRMDTIVSDYIQQYLHDKGEPAWGPNVRQFESWVHAHKHLVPLKERQC